MKNILLFITLAFVVNFVEAQPTYVKRMSFNSSTAYVNPQDSILHLRNFAACTDGTTIIEIDKSRGNAGIYKLDLNGNILWETWGSYHGGNNTYTIVAMKAAPDGGCVYIQNHYSGTAGVSQRAYINKIGPTGNTEWSTEIQPQNIYGNFYQVGYDVAILPTGYACLATDSIYLYNLSGGQKGTINRNGQGKLHGYADGNLFVDIAGFRAKIDTLGNTIYLLNNPVVFNDTTFYTIVGDTIHRLNSTNGNYLSSIYFPSNTGSEIQMLSGGGMIRYNTNQITCYDSSGIFMWTKNITLPHFGINLAREQSDGTILTGGTYFSSKDYGLYGLDYSTFIATIDTSGYSILDSYDQVTPGDANNDGLFDVEDALFIALAQGSTGPRRYDTIVNNEITSYLGGDIAEDFPSSFGTGVNHKQCDYHPDGIVDSLDFETVSFMTALFRWGGIAPLRIKSPNNQSTNPPVPFFSCLPDRDSAMTGDTVRFHFILGDNGIAVDSIFGIAFNLHVDSTESWDIAYGNRAYAVNSQIGNLSDLRVKNPLVSGMQNSLVIARRDLQNAYFVQDTIGYADIIVLDSALGNIDLLMTPMIIRAITASGSSVDLQFNTRPVHLRSFITQVPEILEDKIKLYPIPAKYNLIVNGLPNSEITISIYNYEGKECYSGYSNYASEINLNIDKYTSGIYLLVMRDANSVIFSRKFVKE